MFKAILISKDDSQSDRPYQAELTQIDEADLPEGDVSIDVEYSSLNYKDALAITGKGPVVRKFPMVPGIDLAGTVSASECADFPAGSKVVLTGWGVGEQHWGGMAQKARVKSDWLVALPESLSTRQAMAIGTAGFTAMLCVLALEKHGITPDRGPVLVTGAAGGVGSVAVAILAKLGFEVIASTGRVEQESAFLTGLGASDILPRSELSEPGKPLAKARWAGAVDVVGGQVLANACAGTEYGGVVTACGLAGGMGFPATVAPFILRGVSLIGIDSVMCDQTRRQLAWDRLATDLDIGKLAAITSEIALSEVISRARDLLAGNIRGRTVMDLQA